jgi:hypothetical protein
MEIPRKKIRKGLKSNFVKAVKLTYNVSYFSLTGRMRYFSECYITKNFCLSSRQPTEGNCVRLAYKARCLPDYFQQEELRYFRAVAGKAARKPQAAQAICNKHLHCRESACQK